MKWSGVPPLLVPTVDVVRSEELLHSVQVPFLSCIQESAVPTQQVCQVRLLVTHQVKARQVVTVTTIHIGTMLMGVVRVIKSLV